MFQHGCSVPLLAQRAFFSTGAYFSFRGFDRSPNVCKEGLPFCRSVFLHASNKFCWRLLRLYASLCMQGTCKTHAETFPRAFIRLTQTHRDHLSSGPASLGLVALAGHARSWCYSYGNAMAVQFDHPCWPTRSSRKIAEQIPCFIYQVAGHPTI